MKSRTFRGSLLASLVLSLVHACGQPVATSEVRTSSHDTCVAVAKLEKTRAYDQAGKVFDAEATNCYASMDDKDSAPVGICLKKAEATRKEALVNADIAWKEAMSICEPR